MKEDSNWELLLFQILRVRGNAYYLVDVRHTYTDVILKINTLRDQGLITKSEDTFVLTQKGLQYFHKLSKAHRKRGLYKYFTEANDFKTTALSVNDIYIPRKRFELE